MLVFVRADEELEGRRFGELVNRVSFSASVEESSDVNLHSGSRPLGFAFTGQRV